MQTSLVEIYRAGAPVSYLKGVSHTHYNVCANTYWALQRCTKILHETSDKNLIQLYPILEGSTECRLYHWRMMRGTPSVHLDDLIDMELFSKIIYEPESKSYVSGPSRCTGLWGPDYDISDSINSRNVHLCSEKIYYYEFFLDTVREINWMEKIVPNISKEPCFILCGFAHLKGLISLLQEDGFTCKNIPQSYPVLI